MTASVPLLSVAAFAGLIMAASAALVEIDVTAIPDVRSEASNAVKTAAAGALHPAREVAAAQTLVRPLLSPTRRPPSRDIAPGLQAATVEAPPSSFAPSGELPSWRLIGYARDRFGASALVVEPQTKESRWIVVGDHLADWTVVAIDAEGVRLRPPGGAGAGRETTLRLYPGGDGGTP